MADTIDINVYETTEEVTINATPNVIQVNINKVTSTGAVTSVNGQTGDVTIATSDNNFTNTLKTKLDGIATGAEVNVNADWNATSGDAQILNKPTIPSLTGVELTANKQNSLVTDGTGVKYPTVDAVNSGIANVNINAVDRVSVKLSQAINKGQAVYVSSADGTNIIVSKASNASESTSSKTIGLLETTGTTNAIVNVVTDGLLTGLNTNIASIGDPVWLGVNGDLIYGLTNKPYAPAHLVYIGVVTRVNTNNGEILVKVQNGFELREIHDIDLISNSPTNNQGLIYESASSLWKNKTIDKTLVGLSNVDNTSDTNKPVSTAQQTALDLKVDKVTGSRLITSSESTLLGNTSGTNSGDETTSTIKSKLGITTLSGSNTGDQDLSVKENTANKQNSLAIDGSGVKFPTVDAVNNLSFIDKMKRGIQYFTDFEGNASAQPYLTQYSSGTGSTTQRFNFVPNQTSNQTGFCQYQTGTTLTGYVNHFSEGNYGAQFSTGGGSWVFETSIEFSALSTLTDRYRFITGFSNSATNIADGNGIFFTYDEGGTLNGTSASANWQCITSNSSTRTITTTTVAVNLLFNTLRIEINAAGTSVVFKINGTTVATHTTNIPLGNNKFNVKQGIAKTIGLTNISCFCDYLGYENYLTTPR